MIQAIARKAFRLTRNAGYRSLTVVTLLYGALFFLILLESTTASLGEASLHLAVGITALSLGATRLGRFVGALLIARQRWRLGRMISPLAVLTLVLLQVKVTGWWYFLPLASAAFSWGFGYALVNIYYRAYFTKMNLSSNLFSIMMILSWSLGIVVMGFTRNYFDYYLLLLIMAALVLINFRLSPANLDENQTRGERGRPSSVFSSKGALVVLVIAGGGFLQSIIISGINSSTLPILGSRFALDDFEKSLMFFLSALPTLLLLVPRVTDALRARQQPMLWIALLSLVFGALVWLYFSKSPVSAIMALVLANLAMAMVIATQINLIRRFLPTKSTQMFSLLEIAALPAPFVYSLANFWALTPMQQLVTIGLLLFAWSLVVVFYHHKVFSDKEF